jgi:hypothetical protein
MAQEQNRPVDSSNEHPRGTKLDQIANQHRENLRAESRALKTADQLQGQLDGPTPRIHEERRNVRDLGEQGFRGLNYHQRAIRGDYGDEEKQRAIDAYNRGEQIDGALEGQPQDPDAAAARLKAEQQQTSVDQQTLASRGVVAPNQASTDQAAVAQRMQADAAQLAPGAKPAKVVTSAPVTGVGKQVTKGSTTVHTQPPSKPAKR